ncbi:hypothetical protein DQ04_00481120 [Trypanosoma grayi]|uniref:hypothetical protein n=1 Tax=Trypanosoma grayi TaxID=71804 RepID=UPI0004F48D68|nr:hypothetical protein DQ04_00481120 [Trypanosoma grayi]KEG14417.1 hypothetical protein DQ04_00481120 [Trypanosoma grayi]
MAHSTTSADGMDDTGTGAAYSTDEAAAVSTAPHCAGHKRSRSLRLTTTSAEEVFSDVCEYSDVVEHSNRLLELLRVRRRGQESGGASTSTEGIDRHNGIVTSIKGSEAHCVQPASFSVVKMPLVRRETSTDDVLIQHERKPGAHWVTTHSVGTQTQTLTSEPSDQLMVPAMSRVDFLMLRLCELDALLHIFFS